MAYIYKNGRRYGNNIKLGVSDDDDKAYGFVKAPANFSFDANNTTRELTITLTTHGRPVLLICTGDLNPLETASDWFTLTFYKNSTALTSQICQSNTSSLNNPFALTYLDVVPAGTYTYKATFTRGAGTFTLTEGGAIQSPNFVAFEI